MTPPGVWIVGPSRTGTSMVAGLFQRHGVFFGHCQNPNEHNPKGYFENLWLKGHRDRAGDLGPDWPAPWWERLREEGWDGESPWGFKGGVGFEDVIRPMEPRVVVVCSRPMGQVLRSRRKVPWATGPPQALTERQYAKIREMRWPTWKLWVRTDRLVHGELEEVSPAFRVLDLELRPDVADEWLDPSLWDSGDGGG